ncbi:hypothetical protein MMC14_006746 [Varicellaria rhodocarpa]|nr:hypothetical protein [Varicellaria rhodocarpa]
MATFAQTPVSEWQGDFYLPRRNKITLQEWVRHLLKYKDKRFARHPRFRYVAFNTMMRSEGKKNTSYICKKVNGERITVEELRETIRERNTTLSNHITRSAEQLRGTRPYWKKRSRELENMVLNLDAPHLFFTFNAADL